MGRYLPKNGKVSEINECRKAQVLFGDLSLVRQIFPHIIHKLIKLIIYYISSDYFVNKCHSNQKEVPDFRHGENFNCDREIFPLLKHFFTHNISENRHMKYNT